jgi:hypothetical protein
MLAGRRVTVFRERPFRLLFAARSISLVGDMVVPVALSFALLDLTGSATDLGLVLACRTAPLVVFLLPGGVWADRLPRQRMMVSADLIRCAAQGAVAALLVADVATVWEIGALQVLYGTADALFRPAATAIVPQVVGPESLQEANALLGLARSGSIVVGPAIAGIAVVAVGSAWALGLDALSFAVSATLLRRLQLAPVAGLARAASFASDLVGGWREFWSRTWLWVLVGSFAAWQLVFMAPVMVLGPVVADRFLGGPGAWAVILTASGVGAVAGGVIAIAYKPHRPLLIGSLLFFLDVPQVALLALHAPVWAIATAALADGVQLTFFGAVWNTVLQEHIPPESLSRISAYDWLGSVAFLPVGYGLAGLVAEWVGLSRTLWASAAALTAVSVAVLAVPSVRSLTRRSDALRADALRARATA